MAHLKKRVTFAGVDYILVPVELWEEGIQMMDTAIGKCGPQYSEECFEELKAKMLAYEGTDEVEDSNV